MFNIGDLILYSTHGICRIDDICEKTFLGDTKRYYVLHPMGDSRLSISTPVDSDKVAMLELLSKEEAEEILNSFKQPGIDWIDTDNERNEAYSKTVKKGNRKMISMIANTLMRQKINTEKKGRKFHEKDKKLLTSIQSVLFGELAFSLNTTSEAIHEKITEYMNESSTKFGGDN
jgi:CarD family transcriptional regulator